MNTRNSVTKLTRPTKMDSNFLLLPYLCDGLNALSWKGVGSGKWGKKGRRKRRRTMKETSNLNKKREVKGVDGKL